MTERRPDHGTISEYNNHKCRCDECRSAWSAYNRRVRQERRATLDGAVRPRAERGMTAKLQPISHGRYTTYTNWGCRCDPCREAWNEYCRELNARRETS